MNTLTNHIADYLALRRSLGFKLVYEGQVLPRFAAFLESAGSSTITTELAISRARQPEGVHPVTWTHRLGAVRGLARYLHTIDPATQIPPVGVFAGQGKRPTPYVYCDTDIDRLLDAAGQLQPALWAATCRTLFGLLAVTGMRIGEALTLRCSDVDPRVGVLTVTGGKSSTTTRLLPLHPSTLAALRGYQRLRDRACPDTVTFFVSNRGVALTYTPVRNAFIGLTAEIGLRTATMAPRIHDLRHAFAVRTLLDWYRSGEDITAQMPVLSTYLGHVNPASTYWYMTAVPELMELAAQRLGDQDRRQS
jgi:integrase/recombinase XerD